MSLREVPVVLITGYLGSGKTTLMQQLLSQEQRKVALIVNDMGSINIDASLLSKTGNKVAQVELVELQNGCICCTLRDEFMEEIERLAEDTELEAIFVEASGISEPSSIAGAFVTYEETTDTRVYLKTVVSVVDVDRIYREFLYSLEDEDEADEGDVINFIMDQIEFCNVMLLNKTDLLTEQQLLEVKEALRNLQKEAEMIPCVQGKVELALLLDREDFEFEECLASSSVQQALNGCEPGDENACVDEYGISSFVFEEQRPFNREAFQKFIDDYPQTLIRTKGYIWFSDDWNHIQLFEQAGRNASITELTDWVCSWPEKEIKALEADFPDLCEDWDEVYGDRVNQLVFIGKGYEKSEIIELASACIEKAQVIAVIKTYFINGFLEAGKSTFIKNLLEQDYFQTNERTLLILCEEGEEEYDIDKLREKNVYLAEIDDEEDFTPEYISKIEKEIRPNRVIVEYNGMWKRKNLQFPWYWNPPIEVAVFDATTFEMYAKNMKFFVAEQVRNAVMTVFNRCDDMVEKLPNFRRNVRAVNGNMNVVFEDKNGEMNPTFDEDLPYDMTADTIAITEDTYPIFYLDAMENVERYLGKRVSLSAKVIKKKEEEPNTLAIGRVVMTCCAEDLSVFGFVCDVENGAEFELDQWITVTATVEKEFAEKYKLWYPVLHIASYEPCKEPQNDIIEMKQKYSKEILCLCLILTQIFPGA